MCAMGAEMGAEMGAIVQIRSLGNVAQAKNLGLPRCRANRSTRTWTGASRIKSELDNHYNIQPFTKAEIILGAWIASHVTCVAHMIIHCTGLYISHAGQHEPDLEPIAWNVNRSVYLLLEAHLAANKPLFVLKFGTNNLSSWSLALRQIHQRLWI